MHIGFLTTEYPPLPSGGIGTSIRNLARALVQLGHRVTVIMYGKFPDFEDYGVKVRCLYKKKYPPKVGWLFARLHIQKELQKIVRREFIDIIESTDWCGLSAGVHCGCPIVIRCNGSDTYFGSILQQSVRKTIYWAEYIALHQAKSIASVSEFTALKTTEVFNLKQVIRVIPNGIDISQFSPRQSTEEHQATILYIGTLIRKKGVLDLCAAFSQIAKQYPDIRLQLIGRDAPDKQTAARSTWELCQKFLSPQALLQTEYHNAKPYNELQEYIHKASICVFPSYAEALPLSWMEVMACAKPLIAYDIGWAPEVVEHDVTGLLVAKGDILTLASTIISLLNNREQQKSMGNSARMRVETHFSAEIVAKQSLAWYEDVLRGIR